MREPLFSDDTIATINALDAFSATIEQRDSSVSIIPETPLKVRDQSISAGESGTLLRFLVPIISCLQGPAEVQIRGEGSLRKRTNDAVLASMRESDIRVDDDGNTTVPLKLFPGQTPKSPVLVRCDTTSQLLSGWLIALASKDGGTIRRTTPLVSAPYVTMTEHVLNEAGIEVSHPETDVYSVRCENSSQIDYSVPGDYSSAAFWIVGSALTEGSTELLGLRPDDPQADREIVDLLNRLGAELSVGSNSITVSGPFKPDGFELDASNCPDLVPIVSVLGICARGRVVINNIDHLANKESDRINRTCDELQKTGVDITSGDDRIEIRSGDGLDTKMAELYAHNDHRLAMAFCILGVIRGSISVDGVECVRKSYPNFFDDLRTLGAEFTVN